MANITVITTNGSHTLLCTDGENIGQVLARNSMSYTDKTVSLNGTIVDPEESPARDGDSITLTPQNIKHG